MMLKVMICQYMNRKTGGKRQAYNLRHRKETSSTLQGNLWSNKSLVDQLPPIGENGENDGLQGAPHRAVYW